MQQPAANLIYRSLHPVKNLIRLFLRIRFFFENVCNSKNLTERYKKREAVTVSLFYFSRA